MNNYPSYNLDLLGPKNDIKLWKTLVEKRGWSTTSISNMDCTIDSLTSLLKDVFMSCKSGDRVIVIYSGHGASIKDKDSDEEDGYDESWCLWDNFFTDDMLYDCLKYLPADSMITIISDSCNSGTMTKSFASRSKGVIGKHKKIRKRIGAPHVKIMAREVLLSACKSNESAYEAKFQNDNYGVFSYWSTKIMKKNEITFSEFQEQIKMCLPTEEFPQTPEVTCLPDMIDRKILD